MTRLDESAPFHNGEFNSFGYGKCFRHNIKPNARTVPN